MKVRVEIALTAAEEQFVMHVAKGMRPTAAAAACGLAGGTGRLWLQKPHIAASIRHCAANLQYALAQMDKWAKGAPE